MVETRIAPRHRVMKAGTIEFGSSAIDCVVRNLSITGTASVTLRHHAEGPPLPRREQWARQGRSLESLTPRPGIREQYLPGADPRRRLLLTFFGLVLRSLSASCSMSAATKTGHYDAIDASTTTASPSSTVAPQAALSPIIAASLLAWYLAAIQSLDTDCTSYDL